MNPSFLGTFNRTQFQRFLAFVRSQVPYLDARIDHLRAEVFRVGELTFVFDNQNQPIRVTATDGSYMAKLLAAYEVQGGNPFLDLRTRNMNQALFVVQGTASQEAQYMSNGEPLPNKGLQDAYSAELMRALREPFLDALHKRFGSLERKIRRALDYTDELRKEITVLSIYQEAATVEGSLEYIANQIEQLFSDRNYRAIYDDGGSDPLGINTYAPFSQYDVEASTEQNAPNREVLRPQRQDSGFVAPGGKGRTV
jgi:hypothetical protein